MNWCGPWAGDTQNGTDQLVVSKEPHSLQKVRPCSLSSTSQLVDQNFIQCFPKETNNFSLNQERERCKGSAGRVTPTPAPTHCLLPEPTQVLPSHTTSPAIWPLISKP